MRLLLVAFMLFVPGIAQAGLWSSDTFHQAFNAAARKAGVSMSLRKISCDADRDCRFALGQDVRAEARGGDELDEVAFHIPASSEQAQRRRAALEASRILAVLVGAFDNRTAAQRRALVSTLLDQATGPARRGEQRLERGVIVFSATQPDSFRVYLTR